MASPANRPSRSVFLLEIGALGAAGVVGTAAASSAHWESSLLIVLGISAVASDLTAILTSAGKLRISGSFLALVLAMVLLGGAPAAVIGLLVIAVGWLRWREAPAALLNNVVTYVWFPLLAGIGFQTGTKALALTPSDSTYYLLVFATFVVALALNFTLIAAYQSHVSGRAFGSQVREELMPVLSSELFSAVLAVVTAFVYHQLGLPALVLVGLVLVVFQYLLGELLKSQERAKELARRSRQLHIQAVTDELTGLANRRKLLADLDAALAAGERSEPRLLVLYDLDGFKRYNDTYGHSEGDVLLARLGGRLAEVLADRGCAYRLGGDEFCALIQAPMDEEVELVAAGAGALSDEDRSMVITASYGVVNLPEEAQDPIAALRVADHRMYAQKDARPASAKGQVRDLLLKVLDEQQPHLHEHITDVATLARNVGARLGMGDDDLDDLARLAELHDVGKLAISPSILNKPAPLDHDEWRVMRLHTIIGERMLMAAPALTSVAPLVRASHERWDGGGYPDGLKGKDVPIAARVVSCCDAFDAMVTDRPYRKGMPVEKALAEVRRCSGTQFDPCVVEMLFEEIAGTKVGPRPVLVVPRVA